MAYRHGDEWRRQLLPQECDVLPQAVDVRAQLNDRIGEAIRSIDDVQS